MKIKKAMRAFAVGLSLFILAGCETSNIETIPTNTETTNHTTAPVTDPASDGNVSNASENTDGEKILSTSDLQGTVIEFSDRGCIINPVTSDTEDKKGSLAVIAAEGYEDEGEKISIKYGENCIFQKAVIQIATGKTILSEAVLSDVKKKSSLVLFGNFDDAKNFTATRVVITRYEQGE
ncbi:MAG: hypothetical protein HFI93_04350 [Lachnospiraceae bacterium]|nr:hypothetical protein [Lachnospiraceae bacterium]